MMKKWILMPSGAEYSTDYNLFIEHQLMVVSGRTGTVFIGRLDGTVFLKTGKRSVNETTTRRLTELVHDCLCKLQYGGRIVDG